MIPNNNLSVLPWYRSLDEQNARRWWVYGRQYPLFTKAGFLPPCQIMRDSMTSVMEYEGLMFTETLVAQGALLPNGNIQPSGVSSHYEVRSITISELASENPKAVYIYDLCEKVLPNSVCMVAFDAQMSVLGTFSVETAQDAGWIFPQGTTTIYIQADDSFPSSLAYLGTIVSTPLSSFKVYKADGTLVGTYPTYLFDIKALTNIDVLVYTGTTAFANAFANGQYYAEISDGTNTWYSEVFTAVNDIEPYLKITWWDNEDFVMDAGTIVYTDPAFKNVLYLDSALAKPEYNFEEEGETRDGYFFPTKQISEKRYRFAFWASEYLLDVMRFIRMADYAEVEWHGQKYSLDTFLITPEWEANGDVASVEAVFDTATVAKKIGIGYVRAQ